ncbi:MAG: hypothetical protein HFF42_06830 [Lawsonibacter sp.]|jgi:hypothetical protein|nr:hypothetical protein [Lawsonibacter sp.]
MKRKMLTLFLAALALLSMAVPASADLIWEPGDPFYEKHQGECDYVGREYVLAGYDGKVTVFTAPGSMSKLTLDNGLLGTIQFTWEGKGTVWGYLIRWDDDRENRTEGWVPMDDVSLVYDSQQFMEDHAGEIITETQPVPVDFHEAVTYRYPNGPADDGVLNEDTDYMPFDETFTQVYTDENGLRWGYVGYYMGIRGVWICLDDPMNRELDTEIMPVAPSAAQLRGSATVTAGPPALLIAAVLVAGVAAVTAFLLLKCKKRVQP